MTTYTTILNIFIQSKLKIISMAKLSEYIHFCIDKSTPTKIKNTTSYHHILPQADSCFPEYKSLTVHQWNGVHLNYSDHYYAHWLFTEAIDNYSQLFAFCSMHNKDNKLGRISESDLIPSSEFQKKMEQRSICQSIMYESRKDEIKEKISNAKKGTISKKRKEMKIMNYITKEEIVFTHYSIFKAYCDKNNMSIANLYKKPNRVCGWARKGYENTINWVYVTDANDIYFGPTKKVKTTGSTGMTFK